MKKRKGQLLVGAILLVAILAIIIPVMVMYIQNEAKWSVKQGQNSNAFQLAEAALDRGYQKLVESTQSWVAVQAGQALSGMSLDYSFTDLAGGSYAISITSGPGLHEATIIGIGRDKHNKEVRALKAVYSNAEASNNAIRALQGVTLSGSNEQVEWGSVMAPGPIDTNGRNHPQFRSASSIIPQDTSAAPLNTDSVQWWSFSDDIPPASSIDLGAYHSSAVVTNTHYAATQNWPGGDCGGATTCNTGKTYYIHGDLNVASPGIYVEGNLIITGNLNLPNGRSGQGSPTVKLPPAAWKQYGNDWAYYLAGGPACSEGWNDTTAGRPATFPGLSSSYLSDASITKTFTSGKVIVNGFLYVGGNINTAGGGGQSIFVGSAYVVGSVTSTSNNVCFFYTDEAASQILTTNVSLARQSWQDTITPWPAALP